MLMGNDEEVRGCNRPWCLYLSCFSWGPPKLRVIPLGICQFVPPPRARATSCEGADLKPPGRGEQSERRGI
jgi:hypothetical protein